MINIDSNITVYAVDLTVYITGTGLVKKYYATHGGYFDSGSGVNYYEPRLKQPGNFQQTIFADGTTGGASQTGYGEIVLINSDGGLDAFPTYGLDGRPIVLRRIIAGAAVLLMSCSAEQPVPTWDTVPIRIKDKQQLLDVAVQPAKYAGTNTLPAGVEGTDDIKGQPKPLLFGQASNATPFCVNTSRLIYQGHAGALSSIGNVYDKGVALVFGADRANNAALQANSPAAGTYDTCLAEGMFRLGSSPVGQITFDGIEGATAADRTAAQIAKRIALRGITSGEIDAADVTALDTANSAVVGIYIKDETPIAAALDEVLNSVGAWYGFDSVGVLNMGRLEAPVSGSIATLTTAEILEIERQATNDAGRGVPPYKINLGYGKNYTIQNSDLAGSILALPSEWIRQSSPTTSTKGMAFGNGTFVAVVNAQTYVYTSPDGIAWTQRTIPVAITCVTFGAGQFVAMSGTTSLTSLDGITWASHTGGVSASWQAICYGNGLYTAVSGTSSSIVATSPDGITWTQRALPITDNWSGVTFGNNLFVAVAGHLGIANVIATSPDGITWTSQSLPVTSEILTSITFGNGVFVAISASGVTQNTALTSINGITWTARPMPQTSAWISVVFGEGLFVAVAYSGNVAATSLDGITWLPSVLPASANWLSLGFGDGVFVSIPTSGSYSATFRIRAGSARVIFLEKEYRTAGESDSSVLTKHPTAGELNINTLLTTSTAAATEATRILTLRKVDRDFLSVKVPSSVLPADLLGKVITIQIPRYGYDAGKLFIITGVTYDYELGTTTLQVWG